MMQQAPGMAQPPSMPPQSQQYQQQPPQPYPQQPQHWMMPPPQQQHQVWGQQQPPPHQQVAPPVQQPAPLPQQQYYQQPALAPQPSSADEVRTLWIGDLQYWMDEAYLSSCFAQTNEVVSVKVIRNKQTMQSECYGFIEFVSRAAAERVLQAYNGTLMPNVEQNFRLNWALYGAGERRPDDSPDHTIFVGDLAADVTDYVLQETFRVLYPSTKGAKVVIDRATGRSKGYGFVRFADENDQIRAMTEMNGVLCSTRPMRVGPAANKKTSGGTASYQNTQGTQNDSDPNNTTIFVGNLDSNVTDEHLRQVFSPYGELVHVKIPVGKRCGFVQFVNRSCAEEALRMLNGTQLGGQNVRLSWGRSPSTKPDSLVGVAQPQADLNQWNAGYYGYPQGYDSYGYAAQDPNMYYGGYPGYGNYTVPQQQPQQQVQPQ
ncbi:Polyadenylate-binding protein rbp45 [Ancistrocladus abbreviatus]